MILGSAIDCLCRYFFYFPPLLPCSVFTFLGRCLCCLCDACVFFILLFISCYYYDLLPLTISCTAGALRYLPEAPFKISVHWSSSFFFQIRTWLENGLTIAEWLYLRNPSGRWRMRGLRRSNLRKWSKRQVVHLWQLSSSVQYFFPVRFWKSILRSFTSFFLE